MSRTQRSVAQDVLDAYPLGRHRCLIDVGGGEGGFLAAVGDACAATRSQAVRSSPRRRACSRQAGRAGNAVRGSRRSAATSCATRCRKARTWRRLFACCTITTTNPRCVVLRAIFAALPVGGALLIAEPMAGTRGAEPIGDAYFGFYLAGDGPRPAAHGRRADKASESSWFFVAFACFRRVVRFLPAP